MLSAFKAQAIHELKQGDKSKIASLLAYGDRLLVGLNNGTLRIYRVNDSLDSEPRIDNVDLTPPPSPTKTKAIDLLSEEEKFSRKPVLQLAIIKEMNLLVSLSDSYISLHDLQTFRLVDKLEKSKGAGCFAVTSNIVKDGETGVPELVSRLAVAVRRKVLSWTWQYTEQLPDVTEISLEGTVRSLVWITGTRLIAGMDAGFSIVDIETQDIIPLNKPVSRVANDTGAAELPGTRFGAVSASGMSYIGISALGPQPMATGLYEDQVLVAKDVNTLFANNEGKALEKRQVPWSTAPQAIGYSYPYLLALQPFEKGALQIRNPDTLSLLQTISVPEATILHVPPPNISLAHAGKRFLVASDRMIWRMNAQPYDSQLTELAGKQRFDEAISLLRLLEHTLIDNKAGRIRDIMIQKATALFEERKYQDSMDLFTEAEASPDRVIKMYPSSIAGHLSVHRVEDKGSVDDHDSKSDAASRELPSTPAKSLLGRVAGHTKKDFEGDPAKGPAQPVANGPSSHKRTPSKSKTTEKALEGDDLKTAVRDLTSFLAQARVKVGRYLNSDGTLKVDPPTMDSETGLPEFANLLPQSVDERGSKDIDWQAELLKVAQLVYTTLFRSYMLISPSLAGSLFRIDNFCDPEVVQASLYENHRYNELIDFLHGKKLHREALEILSNFGKGDASDGTPEGMQGPDRTVSYLKQLPPELIDLILEFAAWPLREKPAVGMDVFLADTDNAERLPRDQVLHFLAEINTELEVQYLEHIINELGDETPTFHQRLIDCYIVNLKSDGLEDKAKEEIKHKLEAFLRRSNHYKKDKTLHQLPSDIPLFYEIRAIILSAMGRHEQALSIYVFQLQDYTKAEAYCSHIYIAEEAASQSSTISSVPSTPLTEKPPMTRHATQISKNQPNIFAILLRLYLTAGPSKNWPQALDLLSRHGARLPASSTLDLMPDDLAVQELQDYFRGRLRHSTAVSRQERLVSQLESVRKNATERRLLLGREMDLIMNRPAGRNRRVGVYEEDHCRVCLKRFGASAVKIYPDGEVVHYGCRRPGDEVGRGMNSRPVTGL